MTSAATFTSLHEPVQEDSMEMSSPVVYDDIEIDFDEQLGGVDILFADKDRMTDDSEQTHPATATDHMMEDDIQLPESQVPEQDMQDDFHPMQSEAHDADEDDDLIDYDDEVYDDTTVIEDQPAQIPVDRPVTYEQQPVDADIEQVDEGITRQPEEFATQQPPVILEEIVAEEHPVPEATDAEAQASPSALTSPAHVDAVVSAGPTPVANSLAAGDAVLAQGEASNDAEDLALLEHFARETDKSVRNVQAPAPLKTALSFATDAPGTPTDTGLHPMTLCYGERAWPLFKSKKCPEGLLKNDNLVSVSLAELLNNCRQRMAIKLGEDYSEDFSEEREFVLVFDGLGLSVTESEHPCGVTSLSEVLDVYTRLYANEGVHDIPPLSLTLSTQLKFSSYLDILKHSADAGQGISGFLDHTAIQPDERNSGEEFQDQTAETASTGEADRVEQQYHEHEQAYFDTTAVEGREHDYQEYATAYENAADDQEAQADDEHEETESAAAQSSFETHDSTVDDQEDHAPEPDYEHNDQEVKAHVESSEHYDQEADAPLDRPEVQAVHLAQTKSDERPRDLIGEDEEESKAIESGASSTTLRADQVEDAVEYGTNGQGDYSAFVNEPDEENVDDHSGLETRAEGRTPGEPDAHEAEQYTADPILYADAESNDEGFVTEDLVHSEGGHLEGDGSLQSYEDDQAYEALNDEATDYLDLYEADGFEDQQDHDENQDEYHTGQDFLNDAEPALDPKHDTNCDEFSADAETAKAIDAHRRTTILDPDDDIDFDDDTEEQHEARKTSAPTLLASASGSPSGKRSFVDTDTFYDDDDEPELKKARSS